MSAGDPGDEGSDLPTTSPDLGHAETVAPTLSPAIAHRPEADRLAREVARTRIGNKLFAKQDRVRLGRYHLLELVGAGGMGVVWGAWDPELERRVAIKLVRATVQAARDRILLEGQALAKLSHPNVVPVYDVGVVEEQVYLVMEWVRGHNLRAYCKEPRTIREVLAVYRAAGEGLAAAHDAGLIHRDFKPDNAMRGDDGRVRVLDFGLAREEVRKLEGQAAPSSDATRGAGTPRYMPPEQADGGTLTPAVDQYAFCASLREALAGRDGTGKDADVPRWLDDLCVRGTAREAKDRFASMRELLQALSRDPATVWRRRLVAGAAAIAVGVAFVIGSLARGTEVEQCVGGKDEIARTWGRASRDNLVTHVKTLGVYGAEEAQRLDAQITKYGETWALAHRNTCLAAERGELTTKLYERDLACLTRARVGLEAAIEVLATASPDRLSSAIVAASSLPDPASCALQTLASNVEPPRPAIAALVAQTANAIERVRVLAEADDPGAAAAANRVVTTADNLAYAPLQARAYLAQGFTLMQQEKIDIAIPLLHRAGLLAIDANDDAAFVEAYAREIYAVSVVPKESLEPGADKALSAVPYAEHLAGRLGAAGVFERALLFNNLGATELAAGNFPRARYWFDRSLAEPQEIRERNLELLNAIGNRALVADTAADRERLFHLEQEAFAKLLGPHHRRTLDARLLAANFVTNPAQAIVALREPCGLYRQLYAASSEAAIDSCTYELGWYAELRGDPAEARADMQAIKPTDDAVAGVAAAYLAALDGKLDDAVRIARAAGTKLQAQWWTQVYAADAYVLAAGCLDRLHLRSDAIASARTALQLLDKLAFLGDTPYLQRRVARVRAVLARWLARSDRPEASRLAEQAATWYRAAGGYDEIAAALEQIRAGSQ